MLFFNRIHTHHPFQPTYNTFPTFTHRVERARCGLDTQIQAFFCLIEHVAHARVVFFDLQCQNGISFVVPALASADSKDNAQDILLPARHEPDLHVNKSITEAL